MNAAKYATANFERAGTVVASFEPELLPAAQRVGFITDSTSVFQNPQASSVLSGGKLTYTFTAPAGDYLVIAKVNAPSDSNNSLYISMDTEPTETMAWHMNTTGGFEERIASWGGDTHGNNPAKVFRFDTDGSHTLIIRGREAFVNIDSVIILRKGAVVITSSNGSCSTVVNQCLSGTFNDTNDTTTNNLWSCGGTNGGTTAQCSLPISVQADITPPSLTSISASSITKNSATISWTTNEAATTQIQYGSTASYGNSTSLVSTLTTSHTQALSNLTAKTVYHYRVISKDAAGNTSTSGDGVFSTLATLPVGDLSLPDVEPLIVAPPVNIPPVNVIPQPVTPVYNPVTPPSLISRILPSGTSRSTITTRRTSQTGPFVPLPEITPEDSLSSTTQASFAETVKDVFSYIIFRITNGFKKVLEGI
jgi:hypothetical protein